MTRSKLSDLEKQEIVSCFEQQQDTILGLAERYQVSSSTIRRLLKQTAASEPSAAQETVEEYPVAEPSFLPEVALESAALEKPVPEKITPEKTAPEKVIVLDKKPKLIIKPSILVAPAQLPPDTVEPSSVSVVSEAVTEIAVAAPRSIAPPTLRPVREELQEHQDMIGSHRWSSNSLEDNLNKIAALRAQEASGDRVEEASVNVAAAPPLLRAVTPPQDEMSAILEDLGSSLTSSFAIAAPTSDEDESDDDEDDDSDEFDEDDYGSEEDDLEDFASTDPAIKIQSEVLLEVMPFAQAVLPKICYIVVDRTAELVTRPLKDFGELGQIPADEGQSCTLPVFDNHRIARRFSHRTQRIIKVPNGDMLRSACTQLSAKGITRLLINGQIYAL
jgi:transposase-like protein